MEKFIQLKNVSVGFPPKRSPLFHVGNLKLSLGSTGRVICVLGPTGCGKSTLLKLLANLPVSYVGECHRSGELQIAYLPQMPVIFPELNAYQNAVYLSTLKHFNSSADQIVKNVDRLGKLLRIDWNKLNATPSTYWSGGEIQRISLIRILSVNPELLLMDEPCTGLDVVVRRELLTMLRREAMLHKTTVVYVTHHGDEVLWVADTLIVFKPVSGQLWKTEADVFSLEDALVNPPTTDVHIHLAPFTNVALVENSAFGRLLYPPDAVKPCADASLVIRCLKLSAEHCLIDLADGTRLIGMRSLTDEPIKSVRLDSSLAYPH